jgi:ArsR family transcriptional regulator
MIQQFFNRYADTMSALANAKRLEIVHLLRDGELTVTQLYQMLDLPQANTSQHLQVLRDHQLVTTTRKGKRIYYRLTDKSITKACDLMRRFVKNKNGYHNEAAINLSKLTPLTHDPVCGMQITTKLSDFTASHNQVTYFFCASGCLKKFINSPNNYIKNA